MCLTKMCKITHNSFMNENHGNHGTRFVNAYNVVDHSLRTVYNFRANISFTDLIRRCSGLNTVVRIYEDELLDLARLRNAIVHNKSDKLIAEPNIEVVELLEKIAKLLSTPPLAVDSIASKTVDTAPHNLPLRDLILETARVRHSNIPIYKGDTLIGVIRWRKFVEVLAKYIISQNKSVDEFIQSTTTEEFIKTFPYNNHYLIVSSKVSIEEVLTLFNQNRKLASVIITKDGTAECRPVGIVTGGDVMDLLKVLEDFK